MKQIEILAPAGSPQKLEYAFAYGADAVYAGVPFFSLRARENAFDLESIEKSIAYTKSLNKKIYLTANVFARNRKIKSFYEHLDLWAKMKPHAFIMSDPGLISVVKEKYPDIDIHLSVQANCMNWRSVKFWKDIGVSRVILSRELNLTEIQEIKQRVPDMELEAFVHGAICIAYSGRCLMSSYFSYRDANQGACDNSCREKFNVFETPELNKDKDYYVEDLRNKGELYQINEDEHGTYIMNSKDLNLIAHLDEIIKAGVISLKIEGRTKSLNYLSLVLKAYRKALDDHYAGKTFDPRIHQDMAKISNRGYHTGFMVNTPKEEGQNYKSGVSRYFSQKFAGLVQKDPETPKNCIAIEVRNKLVPGQTLEVISPKKSFQFQIGKIFDLKGNPVESAHGGAGVRYFESPVGENIEPFSMVSLVDPKDAASETSQ